MVINNCQGSLRIPGLLNYYVKRFSPCVICGESFRVDGHSMDYTLQHDERLFMWKLAKN